MQISDFVGTKGVKQSITANENIFINNRINARENRKDNHEWKTQRHRQHWTQDTARRQTKQKYNTDK